MLCFVPINFTDPTGHYAACNANSAARCSSEPPPSLITYSDEGLDFTDEEKATIERSAYDVGVALARDYYILYGVRLTPHQAFLLTYGGTVTFVKSEQTCQAARGADCWGSTAGTEITIYEDGHGNGEFIGNHRFIVHELGHAFESRVNQFVGNNENSIRDGVTSAQADGLLPDRPDLADDDLRTFGFAGPLWGWQQSSSGASGEEFADMFVGWTYGRWESNPDGTLTHDGRQRATFMNQRMAYWMKTAIQEEN